MQQNYAHSPARLLELLATEELWKEPDFDFTRTGDSTSGWNIKVLCPVDASMAPKDAARFIPANAQIIQEAAVPPANANGGVVKYTAYAKGVPVKVTADMRVGAKGQGSSLTVDAELSIKIPFLGAQLEEKFAPRSRKLIQRQLDKLSEL